MKTISTQEISDCVYRLARKAGLTLIPSCLQSLEEAKKRETGATAFALETLLENARVAKNENMPVCQDTGMSVVLIELGQEVALTGAPLLDAVNDGVRRAYADGNFRKSVCDPLTRENTGDNTPAQLHMEIVAGDKIKITYLPKGFGSENMSRLYMLTPAEGKEGILRAITETVKLAGSRPCPPVYVGVGIGGTFDGCALLAKKALTREVGSRNPRKDVAEIEKEALKCINELNI
ncbi:MAG: fumarate hydratase, partial [Clostridia bacterium]|nr:fumarate hydratase [Clostridia bacterium]